MIRRSLTLIGIVAAIVCAMWLGRNLAQVAAPQAIRPPNVNHAIEHGPLTISASEVGDFGAGYSWYLSVNSAGKAELTIDTYDRRIRREFDVTEANLAALRDVVRQERFFELADEYGEVVSDGSTTTLTITAGEATKSVRLQFLGNWVQFGEKAKLQEPSRALRVFLLIRKWFADTEAVDLAKYHETVLNAAD